MIGRRGKSRCLSAGKVPLGSFLTLAAPIAGTNWLAS